MCVTYSNVSEGRVASWCAAVLLGCDHGVVTVSYFGCWLPLPATISIVVTHTFPDRNHALTLVHIEPGTSVHNPHISCC
jgi:hypothetical protein